MSTAEPTATPGVAEPKTRGHAGRTWAVRVIVVLASLVLVVGALAVWIERVLLDESTWTDTSGQMLEDPTIRAALSSYLVDQLYTSGAVTTRLENALPPAAKPLAAPAAAALREPLEQATNRALAAPRVQAAWRVANGHANRQVVALLDGGGSRLSTTNGDVVLDLHPLMEQLVTRVGVGDQTAAALPADAGTIVLLHSNQLAVAQDVAKVLRVVAKVIVVLVVVLFALAVAIAPDRRRAVRACAVGLLVSGLVLIFFRRILGNVIVTRLVKADSMQAAAHSAWLIATEQIALIVTSVVFVGVVGLAGAWFAGPGRRATRARTLVAPYLADWRIAYGALAAVVLLLLAWAPTPAAQNPITVVVLSLLAVLGLEALRRLTRREQERGVLGSAPS